MHATICIEQSHCGTVDIKAPVREVAAGPAVLGTLHFLLANDHTVAQGFMIPTIFLRCVLRSPPNRRSGTMNNGNYLVPGGQHHGCFSRCRFGTVTFVGLSAGQPRVAGRFHPEEQSPWLIREHVATTGAGRCTPYICTYLSSIQPMGAGHKRRDLLGRVDDSAQRFARLP